MTEDRERSRVVASSYFNGCFVCSPCETSLPCQNYFPCVIVIEFIFQRNRFLEKSRAVLPENWTYKEAVAAS